MVNFTPSGEYVVVKSKSLPVGSLDLSKARDEVKDNSSLHEVLERVCSNKIVRTLTLCGLPISGAAFFGGEVSTVEVVKQLRQQVRSLNLTRTDCSAKLFRLLADFPDLKTLICDDCTKLKLAEVVKHTKLEVLSLLGTDVMPQALATFLKTYPALTRLDCTINFSDMVPVGLKNRHGLKHPVVTVQYGHVQPFFDHKEGFLPLHTQAVRFEKIEGVWNVFFLDVEHNAIKDNRKLWIHRPCKKLFQQIQDRCPACHMKACPKDYQFIDFLLDSSVDLDLDFQLLPSRAPWDLVRRSQFSFNGK